MDDAKEITRLSRLTSILILLQSKRLITAAEIANRFQTSKRTAYRDIKALEDAGVPIFTEEGKGYRLLEGYNLPPIMFTEQEANALITAERLISQNKDGSLIQHYSDAIAKIKAVLRHSKKDKANLLSERVVFVKNLNKEITSSFLSNIQLAITHFNIVQIKYHSLGKDEITSRKIEPLALYHTQENWILIAWCHMRNAYREFRLDRIQTMSITETHFPDRDFNLLKYFKGVIENNNSNP